MAQYCQGQGIHPGWHRLDFGLGGHDPFPGRVPGHGGPVGPGLGLGQGLHQGLLGCLSHRQIGAQAIGLSIQAGRCLLQPGQSNTQALTLGGGLSDGGPQHAEFATGLGGVTAQGRHAFRPVHLEGRPVGGQLGLGHGQALGLRRPAVSLSVQLGDLGLSPLQLHLEAHDHLLGGQRRPFPLNAPKPFDQTGPETPTPLPQGLQPHQPVAQVVASPGG